MEISASLQDYLEHILALSSQDESVRVTDLASRLNVAKPSVSQAMVKLKELKLIDQAAYGPIKLTPEGREQAVAVLRRHRLLKSFLIDVLELPADVAERDACLMEHAVSAVTMQRLGAFLESYL